MRLAGGFVAALILAACGALQPSAAATAPPTADHLLPARRFAAWADGVARDQVALVAATDTYDRRIRRAIRFDSYDQALGAFEAYDDAIGAVYRRLGPAPGIDACHGTWRASAGEVVRTESEELDAYERVIARLRRAAEDGAGRSVAGFSIKKDRRDFDIARAAVSSRLRKARSAFRAARQREPACES